MNEFINSISHMSYFEKEINGILGEYVQKTAQKELEELQTDFDNGRITVDENGVLRNCIGRVAVDEICEKCEYIGIIFDPVETKYARDRETAAELAKYREAMKDQEPDAEELYEMQAAFGKGTKVKNVITGKEIEL